MFGAPQRSNVVSVPDSTVAIIAAFRSPVDEVVSFEPSDLVDWVVVPAPVPSSLGIAPNGGESPVGEYPVASKGIISVDGSLRSASFEFNPTGSPMSDAWTADIYRIGGSRIVPWPGVLGEEQYVFFDEFECRALPVVSGETAASAFSAEIVVNGVATPCLVEEYSGGRRFTIPSSVHSDDNDQGTFNLYREGCLVWSVLITEP